MEVIINMQMKVFYSYLYLLFVTILLFFIIFINYFTIALLKTIKQKYLIKFIVLQIDDIINTLVIYFFKLIVLLLQFHNDFLQLIIVVKYKLCRNQL